VSTVHVANPRLREAWIMDMLHEAGEDAANLVESTTAPALAK